jgi:hypothetical protein
VVPVETNDLFQDSVLSKKAKSMGKKRKITKKEKKPGLPKQPENGELESSEEEKPFDFGGLPPRDLKKNLGCG